MSYVTFTDSNFEEVIKSGKPVLVDFWSTSCHSCGALSLVIEELAKDYQDKAKIGKLDVDLNQEATSKFGIMSLPTVILFKNGNPVKSLIGLQPKENYKSELDQLL